MSLLVPFTAPVSTPRPSWTLPSSGSPSQSSGWNRPPLTYPGWVTEGTIGLFSPPGGSGSLLGMTVRTYQFMQPPQGGLDSREAEADPSAGLYLSDCVLRSFPLFGGTGCAQGRRRHPSSVLAGLQALVRFLIHRDLLFCCCLLLSEMNPSPSPLPEPWVFVQCPTWTSVRPS